ncbi:Hypothetical predicted protein [Mytilus galloprovincialis]|uniref:Uncharacterized protein n=1 Tax=Mytilus galloprovincialis TaxID=29158 RepID=A0A8B6GGK3_MYTGA|nr:Hypothetical predicted protein [Mytilus galloprovincialis]
MKVTKGSNRSVQKRPAEAAGGQSSVALGADVVATVSQPSFFVGGQWALIQDSSDQTPETSATRVGCMGIGQMNARTESCLSFQKTLVFVEYRYNQNTVKSNVKQDTAVIKPIGVKLRISALKNQSEKI